MVELLKFSAKWCQPCQILAKKLHGVDLGVTVKEVDVDTNRELAIQYGVRSIPTLVLLKSGNEVGRINGDTTIDHIKQMIKTNQ